MKKAVLLVVLFISTSAGLMAIGLHIFTGGGFGLGLDGNTWGKKIETSGSTYSTFQNYFTMAGRGARGIGSVGVDFGEHFSLELGGGYVDVTGQDLAFLDTGREVSIGGSFVPLLMTAEG